MLFIRKLYSLLDKSERRKGFWLLIVMVIVALFDVVGVASILPFITVASDPNSIDSNAQLRFVYSMIGFNSSHTFMVFLGCLVFSLLLASLAFRSLGNFLQNKFLFSCEQAISNRLFSYYLHMPYSSVLTKNTVDMSRSILVEVSRVLHAAMLPTFNFMTQFFVTVFIF